MAERIGSCQSRMKCSACGKAAIRNSVFQRVGLRKSSRGKRLLLLLPLLLLFLVLSLLLFYCVLYIA
jgi:hypothetical protein